MHKQTISQAVVRIADVGLYYTPQQRLLLNSISSRLFSRYWALSVLESQVWSS